MFHKEYNSMKINIYGNGETGKLEPFIANENLNNPSLYFPSEGLKAAVNVSLALGQPLLLTGEPGTGKTQLAYHVAHFFGLREPLVFNAQTTSTATDLFYRYDALAHFQFSQNAKIDPLSITPEMRLDMVRPFVYFNALGEAIKEKKRVVVLIDEIDKAPRDFPNDLLWAIEKLSFKVPEFNNTEYKSEATVRPIIILTSNSEKNLPDAFLRRVIYFHIDFPEKAELVRIMTLKTGIPIDKATALVTYFQKTRDLGLKKKPATAEMLAWAVLLTSIGFPVDKLGGKLSSDEKVQLDTSYSVLAKTQEDLKALKAL